MKKSIVAVLFLSMMFLQAKTSKIVGLIQVRNENFLMANCLRSLALYTDSIVVLDDSSSDGTLDIVRALAEECHIERIIVKKGWSSWNERFNRNKMFEQAREIGGTHFVMVDADEMFTAECLRDDWLRKQILAMEPGQIMRFPMINFWGNVDVYRDDDLFNPFQRRWCRVPAVFCDDGVANYDDNSSGGTPSGVIHVARLPENRKCEAAEPDITHTDLNHSLMHFKFMDLKGMEFKKVWYMCLEFVNAPGKAKEVNSIYKLILAALDDPIEKIKVTKVPDSWIAYSFFDRAYYNNCDFLHDVRKGDIHEWMRQFGIKYFEPLEIWHFEWLHTLVADLK